MSNPTGLPPENTGDQPDETTDAAAAEPNEAPIAAEQPTEAYPPADVQPTEAYEPAAEQPTEVYPPAPDVPAYPAADASGQPVAGAAPQAAYPPAGYPVATAPKAPDTRPKTFGWVSLGLAVAGLVLVLIAFIPLLWVSFVLALVGGILLLAGLVFGIVTLVNKKQGGKGLGIGAIIVSVLGGGAWIGALIWSLVLIGLASSGSSTGTVDPAPEPTSIESVAPSAAPEESEGTGAATGDEAAFVEAVRPEITALMQEVEPSLTPELVATAFPDETLIGMGQAVLSAGELGRDAFVSSLAQSGLTDEQATRFYDALLTNAQAYLAE
ncbi:MAG: hypothetical protein ABW024_03785 [Microbacterium sp.]